MRAEGETMDGRRRHVPVPPVEGTTEYGGRADNRTGRTDARRYGMVRKEQETSDVRWCMRATEPHAFCLLSFVFAFFCSCCCVLFIVKRVVFVFWRELFLRERMIGEPIRGEAWGVGLSPAPVCRSRQLPRTYPDAHSNTETKSPVKKTSITYADQQPPQNKSKDRSTVKAHPFHPLRGHSFIAKTTHHPTLSTAQQPNSRTRQ